MTQFFTIVTTQKNLLSTVVALIFCILAAPIAFSQSPAPSILASATQPTDDLVTLTFPENLELRTFVQYVSKRLNINILYDEQMGAQKVTIQSPGKIPASSLLDLLRGILKVKGWFWWMVTSPAGRRSSPPPTSTPSPSPPPNQLLPPAGIANNPDTVAVARVFKLRLSRPAACRPNPQNLSHAARRQHDSSARAKRHHRHRLRGQCRTYQQTPGLIDKDRDLKTDFVQVTNSDASQVAQQVTAILTARNKSTGGTGTAQPSTGVELVPASQTNQIVLVGTETAVKTAADLIRTIDAPLGLQTHVYHLASADPEHVDRLAREVIGPLATKRLYRSVIDKEGNSLIVTTTPELHIQLAGLQKELDQPLAASQSPIHYYKLSNATAADVLATIKSLQGEKFTSASVDLGPTTQPGPSGGNPSAFPGSTAVGPGTLPPAGAVVPSITPPVAGYQGASTVPVPAGGDTRASHESVRTKDAIITADKNTNTIIVIAAPEVQRVYEQMIQMLDKRRPQVLIECTVVTLDATHDFNLGVEISGNGAAGTTKFINFSNFGLDTPSSSGQLTLTPGLGFNGAVVNANVGQIIVHSLQTDTNAKVLSAPRILVNDNATGTLASVNEQPTTNCLAIMGNSLLWLTAKSARIPEKELCPSLFHAQAQLLRPADCGVQFLPGGIYLFGRKQCLS